MKKHHKVSFLSWFYFLLSTILLDNINGYADDLKQADLRPNITAIELTESFYRALQNEQSGGDRVYGNTGKSDEYLRQIAISTKFMVETNIQIIKQQEKMIELLGGTSGKRGR